MNKRPALNWLIPLIALLAVIAAAAGLFWLDGGAPFDFTTLHGKTVQIYGQGLYYYDTVFSAAGFRGTDAITLFVAVPLLVISAWLARRGSLRGQLVMTGALGFFLYNSASLVFGAAFNALMPLYVAYFSASLFAFILAFNAFDLERLAGRLSQRAPRRGAAIFMLVAGIALVFVWGSSLIEAVVGGGAPDLLDSYTTLIIYPIDLGIIAPAAILSGVLLLRRAPLGNLLALVLLILNALIGLVVASQTIFQQQAGITLTAAEMVTFVGSFMVMSLFAIGLTVAFLRAAGRTALA